MGPYAFEREWQRDGFLMRSDGVTYPDVSGVLVGTAIQEHNFNSRAPTLYENPAARQRVPQALAWARVRTDGNSAIHVAGMDPAERFGKPSEWPGVPWPR